MTSLQIIILFGAILQFVFELFLKIKNERHISSMRSEMPKGVNAIMDESVWRKATDYSIEKKQILQNRGVFGDRVLSGSSSPSFSMDLFDLVDVR